MADPVFFSPSRLLTLGEVAAIAGGVLERGDPSLTVRRVAPLADAGPGDLAFLDNPRYLADFAATRATACIIAPKYTVRAPEGLALITSGEPYRAMALVMQQLFPQAFRLEGCYGTSGVSPAAHVHPDARLEEGVTVEPGAVIGAGAEIGCGTVVSSNAVIGAGVRIGRDGYIGPGCSILFALIGNRVLVHGGVRIGQDGFGFAMGARGHLKVPQIGRVVIQDDVEIGANTTIDRGSNRDTVIGEGTKIDNAVQIGHNVTVGRHCILVAQTGISGSTLLGDFVALGGQAGIAGHLTIGPGAQIAGSSSVKDDIPAGERWAGTPARPVRRFMREQAALARLAGKGTGDDKS